MHLSFTARKPLKAILQDGQGVVGEQWRIEWCWWCTVYGRHDVPLELGALPLQSYTCEREPLPYEVHQGMGARRVLTRQVCDLLFKLRDLTLQLT